MKVLVQNMLKLNGSNPNTIVMVMHYFARYLLKYYLSYGVASGSEITSCNKIDKPLLVYRFTGKVMTSILHIMTKL